MSVSEHFVRPTFGKSFIFLVLVGSLNFIRPTPSKCNIESFANRDLVVRYFQESTQNFVFDKHYPDLNLTLPFELNKSKHFTGEINQEIGVGVASVGQPVFRGGVHSDTRVGLGVTGLGISIFKRRVNPVLGVAA